jgi:hypothetical protein
MTRPFWGPFWVPFWGPFWGPIRTGPPSVAQKRCILTVSGGAKSTRQPSGLRECAERGTCRAAGRPGGRRLAFVRDRWSHARPANRHGPREEVSR